MYLAHTRKTLPSYILNTSDIQSNYKSFGSKRLAPLLTHKNSQKRQVLDISRRLLQLVKQERAKGYLDKGKVAKEGGGKVRC